MERYIDNLRQYVEGLKDSNHYKELDELVTDIEFEWSDYLKDNAILDISNFKRLLEQKGLMSKALEEFIENYMRFDNVC